MHSLKAILCLLKELREMKKFIDIQEVQITYDRIPLIKYP